MSSGSRTWVVRLAAAAESDFGDRVRHIPLPPNAIAEDAAITSAQLVVRTGCEGSRTKFGSVLERCNQGSPTARMSAVAWIVRRVILRVDVQGIVQEQLLAGPDGLDRLDPHGELSVVGVRLDGLAVRFARMIQVSRRIAVLGPVNQRAVRQSEQIGQSIVPCHGAGLVRGVATTGVSADQGPGWQLAYREDTVAMHATMAHLDMREGGSDVLGALHGAALSMT